MKKKLKNLMNRCSYERFFVTIFFFLVIAAGFCGVIFLPKKEFSSDENRMLEKLQPMSAENLISGTFMNSAENFVSDHFPIRRENIELNTTVQYLCGRRDFASNYGVNPAKGGVYFGKNNHIYDVLLPNKTDVFKNNADAVIKFAKSSKLPFTLVPVPAGAQEQKENLPAFAPSFDEKQELNYLIEEAKGSNVKVVNLFDALSLKNGDFYFKTDHHWNLEGAFVGYTHTAKAMGIVPDKRSEYEFKKVSDSFYGTLYSKAIAFWQEPDSFYLPIFKKGAIITQQTGKKVREDLYWNNFLKEKDKYSVFLGGNHAVDILRNGYPTNHEKLLVIKDSYANSMLPFLARNVEEIHVIDLRHFNKDIYEYINKNKITSVLAVYSLEQLSDVSIAAKLAV